MTSSAVHVTYIVHSQQFSTTLLRGTLHLNRRMDLFFNFPNVYVRQNDAPSPPLSDWFSGGVSDHVFNNKAYNSCFFHYIHWTVMV